LYPSTSCPSSKLMLSSCSELFAGHPPPCLVKFVKAFISSMASVLWKIFIDAAASILVISQVL
jgi:hypothetical protein